MTADTAWAKALGLDVQFGYLSSKVPGPRRRHPQVVLNTGETSVLRTLREELRHSDTFFFSVAFVSPRAIALLKQELIEFEGRGHIVTSDYLAFNSPAAFAELLNLKPLGIDVRIHQAPAFHPKGYIFEQPDVTTAIIGSANLTENALVRNHEWNLKVSAAKGSDLERQTRALVERELENSVELTKEWVDRYAEGYVPPHWKARPTAPTLPEPGHAGTVLILPNKMQLEALAALKAVREKNERRAIVISATGTGKTMLSAFDVRAVNPRRFLFVVHREQILNRTIEEYRRVIDAPASQFGKLTGNHRDVHARYLFATIQTLSRPEVLAQFAGDEFDYVIIDEAHRSGSPTYRRVLQHFDPQFLLGMTATPERTDGFDVFELYDYNVPYEIRLNHALEEDMLSPFHYYGVSEVQLDDGTTITDDTELSVLVSPERVDHLVKALETYGQAGIPPRGLIFCARNGEAAELSEALNRRTLRGKQLRTVALSGKDSPEQREATVARLEAGELDYVLTVDIFNEGVDIPSINQVVMLRQTQSAIVFVQQLGRGLRKSPAKEYLVVIDFIGNYANNFMIPIALFGDESLNKESLRKNLIAAEESGVLPGLSSVRFDRVAQKRVLASITNTTLDSMQRIKGAIESMRHRVGGVPDLWDFLRFESVDPVLLATKKDNYPVLTEAVLKVDHGLTTGEHQALKQLSHEILPAKRAHEFLLLEALLESGSVSLDEARSRIQEAGFVATDRDVRSAVETFTLEQHAEIDQKRYGLSIGVRTGDGVALTDEFRRAYADPSSSFRWAVDDLLKTGMAIVRQRYGLDSGFIPGFQYSRKEVCRLLGLPRKWTSTLYGYKVDWASAVCPIFVTLHKSDDIVESTQYEDALLDRTTMRWYTRARRTLKSGDEAAIIANRLSLPVFVKKDDAEGTDFYYLGSATAHDAEQTTMAGSGGATLDVVRMLLRFDEPIDIALYDYFHPVVSQYRPSR